MSINFKGSFTPLLGRLGEGSTMKDQA